MYQTLHGVNIFLTVKSKTTTTATCISLMDNAMDLISNSSKLCSLNSQLVILTSFRNPCQANPHIIRRHSKWCRECLKYNVELVPSNSLHRYSNGSQGNEIIWYYKLDLISVRVSICVESLWTSSNISFEISRLFSPFMQINAGCQFATRAVAYMKYFFLPSWELG